MKSCLITLLILQTHLLSGQILFTSGKDKAFDPGKHETYLLTPGNGVNKTIFINGISAIDIVDARADTFALGYMKKGLFRSFKKIQFATPGLTGMFELCERVLYPDTIHPQFRILMVVKELWLSEEDTDMDDKDKIQDFDQRLYPTSYVKCKFEFYLKKGEKYFALYRFDTSLLKTLPLKLYAAEHIKDAVISSLNKASTYDFQGISKTKTPAAMSSIEKYNNNRFNLPILKDTSFKKGVYMSFNDFKNNNPSITEFEIKKGRLGDALYTKSEDGKWVVNRTVWGYCFENNLFIKSGDNYFQLQRIGNSYYFNGSKGLLRYNYNNKNTTEIEKRYINMLSPLKLDITTGTIY